MEAFYGDFNEHLEVKLGHLVPHLLSAVMDG
jgi:hypothetical protein